MPKVIRVVYENGVFKPLEKVDIEEGKELRIRIEEDIIELARKFSGIGKYGKKLTNDKLYRIEVDLLE